MRRGNQGALQLVDGAIAEVRRAGRADLADKLAKQRRQLVAGTWHVLVAGEYKKGKSALVNGLLGVEVCGVDPIAFTAVPTLIRHGDRPSSAAVPDMSAAKPSTVDIRRAAEYGRLGIGDDGLRLRSVEIALPRELLAMGMVLVDTPGVGGGFAAAAAAAAMRAMTLAEGVIVVTDASQELTSAELEFIKEAARACPNLLCVLTKIDFYPQWQRILELDRAHLADAGVAAEIIAVSSTLRQLALERGDAALNAESGFPVLVDRISKGLSATRAARLESAVAATVHDALRQVAVSLNTEHDALIEPARRQAAIRRIELAEQRAKQLTRPSARWLNVINDEFADIQSAADADLTERVRRLEADASRRVNEGDPTREWAELVPWLYRRTNEELTRAHTRLDEAIDELTGRVAELFDASAREIAAASSATGPALAGDLKLGELKRRGGKLETGMHAARGLSLSGSVITMLLITTLNAPLLVFLPVTAVLGGVFSVYTVRGYKTSKLDQARNEATRAVTSYLNQACADAQRASADLIRHSRAAVRDFYLDHAAELVSAARHEQAVVTRAVQHDGESAAQRGAVVKAELDRVSTLAAAAQRMGARVVREAG